MIEIEIHDFQNLRFSNTLKSISKPLLKAKEEKKNVLSIVFVRDPYAYFDYLIYEYLKDQKSILFTQDIINHMKMLNSNDFLVWLDTLSFIPFYNPQTFQMDISKRSDVAINNLESFDYVVPFDEIDSFLENVPLTLEIDKIKEKQLLFSLSREREHALCEKFLGKDIILYKRTQELWNLIKINDFKPLKEFRKKEKLLKEEGKSKLLYKGTVDKIDEKNISGWVCHKKHAKSVLIEIYHNGEILKKTEATHFRPDIRDLNWHPTGYCGFKVAFEEPTFKKGDIVEIKVLPENENIILGKKVKEYLYE